MSPITDEDVAVFRLVVTTALLHGAMPAIATLPSDQFDRTVDRLRQLGDALVAQAGIKAP